MSGIDEAMDDFDRVEDLDDLFYRVERLTQNFFATWDRCSAAELGLDRRSHYDSLYYSRDGIAVQGSTRSLDYYGGFEYVKGVDRRQIGDWMIYLSSCRRVRGHLQRVLEEDEARSLRAEYGEYEDED